MESVIPRVIDDTHHSDEGIQKEDTAGERQCGDQDVR